MTRNSQDNDIVTVVVEPSSGIMRATWARPLLTRGLIDSYHHLLDAAEASACCRLWHLDLRTRIWPAATFMQWLSDTFAPWATQRLGGPVFVACWVCDKHLPHVEHARTVEMQRRVAKINFHPRFFTSEPEARAWLLQTQVTNTVGAC